jgi:alkylation response protein AidB-like acyl-CoA dehydrogenase
MIAGAMQRVLEMSIDYANTRTQFGKRLGQFQAVQHMLAVMSEQVATAAAAADMARNAILPINLIALAAAKATASEAAGSVAMLAHQIHGAIGITREHSLQLYTRRLWSWRDEFGAEDEWNAIIGSDLLSGNDTPVWHKLTAVAG